MIETIEKRQEDTLKNWLKNRLSEHRFQHSLGSQQKAVELARNFKFNAQVIEKASLAALLHDCAKLMTPEELLAACDAFDISVGDAERQSPQTLHPFVGAELVAREFDIRDDEILNAIRFHTTGRAGMTTVEKLVYVADKIEENTRNPLYTQKIMDLIEYGNPRTLDEMVLYILESTIIFLMEKGQVIHLRTIEARNDLVSRLKPNKPVVST